MSAIFTATTRHRRVVLAVALAVAAGYPVGWWLVIPGTQALDDLRFFGLLAVVLMFLLLSIVALLAERPAAFVVRPEVPAFSTPASATAVYVALLFTFIASGQVGPLVASIKSHDLRLLDAVLVVLLVPLAGLRVADAWRGLGVQLRPEGLWWWEPAGSVRVPWQALAPGYPRRPAVVNADFVTLTYARPELVGRRGLVFGKRRLPIDNIHAWFIADAIRHYVAHPEHRAAIGTQAEYRRLLHAMREALIDPPATPETGSNS